MTYKYNLESLISTFEQQADQYDKDLKNRAENYVIEYCEEYPHQEDYLNICRVLLVICQEIQELKK